MKRLIEEMPFVHKPKFVEGEYCPEDFFKMAKGLEDVPEGGERCFQCFRMRMEEAARLAAEGGYDYFTTTLTISPLKNAQKINEIGEELAEIYDVKHLPSDLRRKTDINVLRNCQKNINYIVKILRLCIFEKRKRRTKEKILHLIL